MFTNSSRYIATILFAIQTGFGQSGDGTLDLRTTDLAENSIALDGFWQFYPRQILRADDANAKDIASTIKVPSWWKATETNPPLQYASYRLLIKLPKDHPQHLALNMPPTYSSYELFVDGKLIGSNGKVGPT